MKNAIALFLVLLLTPLAALQAEESTPLPPRPEYPVKMDAMTDAEFGRMFFAEIDLAHRDMAAVKPLVEKQEYAGALAAWRDVFVQRCRRLPLVPWPGVNRYWLDVPTKPDRVLMQHGEVVKDFGPVGQMDRYGLEDWCLHVNMMWHPGAIAAQWSKTPPRRAAWEMPRSIPRTFCWSGGTTSGAITSTTTGGSACLSAYDAQVR